MALRERFIYAIDIVSDGADTGLKRIRTAVAQTETRIGKMRTAFRGAMTEFRNSRGAQAAVAGGIALIGQRAISAASDLEESSNAVRVTFGDTADAILEMGEAADTAMGLSQTAFNQAAVQFSNFAKQIAGTTGESVPDVLEDLMVRASDFASVMNLELNEAIAVFMSTLSGETEPIRRFGIDVSAAAVQSNLLADGTIESAKAITEADKVLGRYRVLMEGTADTAGDFQNTSDGLANSQRIMAAQVENLAAELGQRLLPALSEMVSNLNQIVDLIDQVGGLDTAFELAELGTTTGKIDKLRETVQGYVKDVRTLGDTNAEIRQSLEEQGFTAEQVAEIMAGLGEVTEGTTRAQQLQQQSIEQSRRRLEQYGHAGQQVVPAIEAVNEGLQNTARLADLVDRRWRQMTGEIEDEQGFIDAANAIEDLADAQAEAATKTNLTEREQRELRSQVLRTREEVIRHVQALGTVPTGVATQIDTAIDQGRYDYALQLLRDLQRPRTVNYVPVVQPPRVRGGRSFSHVGRSHVEPGRPYVIGRPGAEEVFVPDSAGSIRTRQDLARGDRTSVTNNTTMAPSMTVNLTVNAGMGADGATIGRDIVNAINTYYRAGGTRIGT